jgi:hypothetical protein
MTRVKVLRNNPCRPPAISTGLLFLPNWVVVCGAEAFSGEGRNSEYLDNKIGFYEAKIEGILMVWLE